MIAMQDLKWAVGIVDSLAQNAAEQILILKADFAGPYIVEKNVVLPKYQVQVPQLNQRKIAMQPLIATML